MFAALLFIKVQLFSALSSVLFPKYIAPPLFEDEQLTKEQLLNLFPNEVDMVSIVFIETAPPLFEDEQLMKEQLVKLLLLGPNLFWIDIAPPSLLDEQLMKEQFVKLL